MSLELLEFSLDDLVKDILKAIMNGALRAVIISILSSPLLQNVLLEVVTPLSYCLPLLFEKMVRVLPFKLVRHMSLLLATANLPNLMQNYLSKTKTA